MMQLSEGGWQMEYTVNKLAKLAGVSARTLRYYDACGLLTPHAIRSNGYRIYGDAEVDRLQQILFYRELGVTLTEIRHILSAENFDRAAALSNHLVALLTKRKHLDALIANVEKSIRTMKGEETMTNEEKFEGFLQNKIAENERLYGKEIREKYGDEVIDQSNARFAATTQEQYDAAERQSQELNDALKAAFEQGDPRSADAQKVCLLHKEWLTFYWGREKYSKEAHLALAEMYVSDPRFTAYYDKIAPGCAVFLRDALAIFCAE
jgi:DNA-binding transcriptional MerR regulator